MSESRALLVDTAQRLFRDLAASGDQGLPAIWPQIEAAGFPLLLVPEEAGGFGGDWGDAFAVARLAGLHALAAPLAEAIVAGWALARGGLPHGDALFAIGARADGRLKSGRFTGRVIGAPWGASASHVLVQFEDRLIRLPLAAATAVETIANMAGEPRCGIAFEAAEAEVGEQPADLFGAGALMRTAQIAGALDAALELSIRHANERVQFGRPIAKFQALQQSLAVLAEEAAAVNCAGQAAALAADRGDAALEIAAAKLRANQAVGVGVALAHQAHGAIGFTREHDLHRYTLRLSAWRSEFGNDRFWSERLGGWVAALGADGLWAELTRRSDAA
ncbi:MAG TPA: acyl-CoA dehydrogenase family protein [Phenylobacterium sp.]|nr:acyl-CoA dehydrogenase family protein [Phenylobacterium sp.]